MAGIRLIERAEAWGDAPAIASGKERHSYAELLRASADVAAALLEGGEDLGEARVALLVPEGSRHVAAQWGIWRAGGTVVPLGVRAARPEIEHVLGDAAVSAMIVSRSLRATVEPLGRRKGLRLLCPEDVEGDHRHALPSVSRERQAMIVYTSGTTRRPEGVVLTHASLEAQITALVEAWEWGRDDRIPLFLPLHHLHGIVNVLGCALWSGALVEAFESFDLERVLGRVEQKAYTLFMAVPTIYVRLIEALESTGRERRHRLAEGFAGMRLMVSGSAALPARVHSRWAELTGQALLERYGMTEIGMALSNPVRGERRPGAVGQPLPGVEVRLASDSGALVEGEDVPGEILVRGAGVFREYWNDPEATKAAFVDGWFRTGDLAVRENGYYRILGRLSVDIIKSGGHKLSALEIEATLEEHPAIAECAVVGVADATHGEVVAVAAVTTKGAELDLAPLRTWAAERLSPYKVPRRLMVVPGLPRNALGKVNKPAVRALFERE